MSEKNLGEFIKNKRLDKHLTRDKLAVILNITAGHLNAIERGIRTPSRDLMRSIAKEIGVDIEVLFNLLETGVEGELTQLDTNKPKSRIPDLEPDPPLEPELQAILDDPELAIYFSRSSFGAKLSNRQKRQIALNIKMMYEENEERERDARKGR